MLRLFIRYPLKYAGPIFLAFLGVLLAAAIFVVNYSSGVTEAESKETALISQHLNEMQGTLDAFLRFDDEVNIGRVIANNSLDPSIVASMLIGPEGKVRSASLKKHRGEHFEVLLFEEGQNIVKKARDTLRLTVVISADGTRIYAACPVRFNAPQEGLRSSRTGVYLEVRDFSKIKDALFSKERLSAIRTTLIFVGGIFFIALFVYISFVRRIERIVIAAKRFAQGDKEARAAISGNDEIAELGRTFDGMIERVVAYQKDIENYVDEIDRYIITSSTDIEGKITNVSQAFCDISGYTKDELIGVDHAIVRHPDMPDAFYERLWATIKAGKIWQGEIKNLKKDGGFYWVDAIITPNFDKSGSVKGYTAIRQDITDKKLLAATQESVRKYVETVDRYVITSSTDLHGNIISASEAFSEISGYAKEELIGKRHNILRHPDMPAELYENMWSTISSGKTWRGEIKNLKKDGGYYWVDAVISPNFDEKGKIRGYTAIRQDISDKKVIEEISITDPLTGLYNRRYYNQKVEEELYRARREKKCFVFVIMDVDNFKKYNDNYGHQKGDEVLVAVGRLLNEMLQRAGDYAFRLGGEEFGLLFAVNEPGDAMMFTQRVCEGVEGLHIPHEFNDASRFVTASFGLRMLDFSRDTLIGADTLYRQADEALYAAKEQGRNRVVHFGS